jgi:hypothetical protein
MATITPARMRAFLNPYGARYIGGRARTQRGEWLLRTFPDLDSMRVLDLGGVAAMWEAMPTIPAEVVLLNSEVYPVPHDGRFSSLAGDACEPSDKLLGEDFDLVFSNSVIEHVGGHHRRSRFAEAVEALAPRHWIQTPNRYFPLEPHWLFPGFQFLPTAVKARLFRVWHGQFSNRPTSHRMGVEWVLDVELLTKAEMAFYFPSSRILKERLVGLPKSLVAVKS